ncbi:MAG: NUDIX hydrolase [Taibaiella sp.]|nr:NUDIX hydrolase [Taibaiella sp.]
MADQKWKILSSTYIHSGPWATLRRDRCEMPDGKIVPDYYVLEYPNWVNIAAFTEDNKVLMVKQYRHAAGIISTEVPGGVIDPGEQPIDAARRELMEETGYQFDDIELMATVYPNPATANNVTYLYLARGGRKVAEQNLDENEQLTVHALTIPEVKQLLLENRIEQALHCTTLFYAFMKMGEL